MSGFSDNPKERTIGVRLNDKQREYLETVADNAGISISQYIRELIQWDMESENEDE